MSENLEQIRKLLSAAETLASHPDLGPTNETLPKLIALVKQNVEMLEKRPAKPDDSDMKIIPLETGPLSRPAVGGRPPATEPLKQLHVKLPESRHARFLDQCEELGAKPSAVLRTLVYNYLEGIEAEQAS